MTDDDPRFPPLPGQGRDGPRRCGVEIEFAGLTEKETADIVATTLGGQSDPDGAHAFRVEETAIGTVKVELDTALRKTDLPGMESGLDLARAVVPVEIVSEPLDTAGLGRLDALRAQLRAAGAQGSGEGVFLGFGVHLNPETPTDPAHAVQIIRAYALLEDWLRRSDPIDTTRRVLPFVDPWPHRLTDALIASEARDPSALIDLYAAHTSSRNHGLDLLPIFRDADPEAFATAFPDDTATSGRPAFHFRLPDCRIDRADWTLADPWRGWMQVERLAQDTALFQTLAEAWRAHRERVLAGRGRWAEEVQRVLSPTKGAPS